MFNWLTVLVFYYLHIVCEQISVKASGARTRAIFDTVFDEMVAAAQPIPGFRRVKGGKVSESTIQLSNGEVLYSRIILKLFIIMFKSCCSQWCCFHLMLKLALVFPGYLIIYLTMHCLLSLEHAAHVRSYNGMINVFFFMKMMWDTGIIVNSIAIKDTVTFT